MSGGAHTPHCNVYISFYTSLPIAQLLYESPQGMYITMYTFMMNVFSSKMLLEYGDERLTYRVRGQGFELWPRKPDLQYSVEVAC